VAAWLSGETRDASPITQRMLAKINSSADLQKQLRAQDSLASSCGNGGWRPVR